jgi:hypothetical protein
MVEFYKNILVIDGAKVDFFTEIDQIIDLNEKIIVKVYSTSEYADYQVKDNIFAINRKGEILWQVETPFQHWLNKKVPQIYYNINYQNDKLTAQNGGSLFFIDTENGKIVDRIDDYGREKP